MKFPTTKIVKSKYLILEKTSGSKPTRSNSVPIASLGFRLTMGMGSKD